MIDLHGQELGLDSNIGLNQHSSYAFGHEAITGFNNPLSENTLDNTYKSLPPTTPDAVKALISSYAKSPVTDNGVQKINCDQDADYEFIKSNSGLWLQINPINFKGEYTVYDHGVNRSRDWTLDIGVNGEYRPALMNYFEDTDFRDREKFIFYSNPNSVNPTAVDIYGNKIDGSQKFYMDRSMAGSIPLNPNM